MADNKVMPFIYESKCRLTCQVTQMVHGAGITLVENLKKKKIERKKSTSNIFHILSFKLFSQITWHIVFCSVKLDL